MHNKYATFVLPIVAGLAIVGAGFSTWVFANQNDSDDSLTGTVSVTGVDNTGVEPTITIGECGVEANQFTAASNDTFTVELDQGGVSAATDITKGITVKFSDTTLEDGLIDFQWKLSADDTTAYSNAKVYLTYSLSLDGVVSNYAELKGTTSGSHLEPSTAALISELEKENGCAYINVNANLTGNIWNYKEGAKPTSLDAYNSMSSALEELNGSKATITLTVTSHYILNTESAVSN